MLAQLAQLRHSCEAFCTGELRVLRAEDGILHYQRIGKTETAEIIVNRSEHIIVEPLASGKHTEVNPMGFTIVVEENGHNPNHSYYDIQYINFSGQRNTFWVFCCPIFILSFPFLSIFCFLCNVPVKSS